MAGVRETPAYKWGLKWWHRWFGHPIGLIRSLGFKGSDLGAPPLIYKCKGCDDLTNYNGREKVF